MQERTCGRTLPYKASVNSITACTVRPCPSYKQDNRTRSPSSSTHFTHSQPTFWITSLGYPLTSNPVSQDNCYRYWKFSVFLWLFFIFVVHFRTRQVYEILSVYLHVFYFSFFLFLRRNSLLIIKDPDHTR